MKQKISKERKGELYIVSMSLLWSFFPIITILAINEMAGLYVAAWSTLFAAVFFVIVVTWKKQWHYLKDRSALKDILIATFFVGILFYVLIFLGLQYTSAGNASIIALMETFFTMFILGVIWKKEKVTKKIFIGALFMVIGAFIVLFKGSFDLNKGDLLILASTTAAPFGNYFAQRARKTVSSEFIMTIRSIISAIVIFGLAFALAPSMSQGDLISALPFLLINGIILLGFSKTLWLEAIHRITISKAITLFSITPAFTLIFAFFILKEVPTIFQIVGFIPLFIGVLLLTSSGKK